MVIEARNRSPLGAFYRSPLGAFGPGVAEAPPTDPEFTGICAAAAPSDITLGWTSVGCQSASVDQGGPSRWTWILRLDYFSADPPAIPSESDVIGYYCQGQTSGVVFRILTDAPDFLCGSWPALPGRRSTSGTGTPLNIPLENFDYYPLQVEVRQEASFGQYEIYSHVGDTFPFVVGETINYYTAPP